MKHPAPTPRLNPVAASLLLGGLLLPSLPSGAASLEVANAPVNVGTSVAPNVMFILDDSGSMSYRFMPREIMTGSSDGAIQTKVDSNDTSSGLYAYWSSHCNGVAFNPNADYPAPVQVVNGVVTTFPDMTLAAAESDGFNPGSKVSLSGHSYYVYTGTQADLGWTYTVNGVDATTTFYKECMSSLGSAPGASVFTKTSISGQSATLQQKYANWYSYYRRRDFTMRSAVGLAFKNIDDSMRVGFTTINYPQYTAKGYGYLLNAGLGFVAVNNFGSTQKTSFYDNLNRIGGLGDMNTPLRGSLSWVGRYFGGKISGKTSPITSSCQRNFTILSTDGYWTYKNAELSYDKAFQLDGSSTVGQQDVTYLDLLDNTTKDVKPPMYDANKALNSLADMAFYLWATDLRPDLPNTLPPLEADGNVRHQHMNLYTIGLGVKGTLNYSSDYLGNPSGSDYAALISGTKNWPVPTGTTLTVDDEGDATHIDDLWHAAINGHGQHFSVSNSTELSSALAKVINDINKKSATGSSAAISSQTPTQADNWVFVPSYVSSDWGGHLRAFQMTVAADGTLTMPKTNDENQKWDAAEQLDNRTASRTIYFNSNKTLKSFEYANLTTQKTYFDNRCSATEKLSQCDTLSAAAKANITGENLVNYLRGDKTYASGTARAFRTRASLLGDIINSSPVYVGKPPFMYSDAGYSSFVTSKTSRKKMVYVGANDGMLHAFAVEDSGNEQWAFIPTPVMQNMWRLADDNYPGNHRYYVDATPTLADVYDGSAWRTILVGGLGAGGRGYYALDVTDPESPPKLLWEYTSDDNANLGLTFGNPIVTKNKDGKWVVAISSGINNGADVGGDGVGRLTVLDAITGTLLSTTKTCTGGSQTSGCVGDSTTPNHLVPLNAWTVSPYDNTTLRYYGGDMSGNLWRFDPDGVLGGAQAQRLGIAQDGSGKAQPITIKPILTELQLNGKKTALISVGTGRLLNKADVTDTSTQTIYTVRDNLDNTDLGVLRNAATMVKLTQTTAATRTGSTRTSTPERTIEWATDNGWYMDLSLSAGERFVINGVTVNGTLGIASLMPNSDECVGGGSSYLYLMGLAAGTTTSAEYTSSAITGVTVVISESGKAVLATTSSGELKISKPIPLAKQPGTTLKRTAWRELVD